MKIKSDFVTNSSSTSFVCAVCSDSFEGFDACLSDGDFYECINGHTLCSEDLLEEFDYDEEDENYNEEWASHYQIPEKYCPICNFVEPDYNLIGKYFAQLYGITRDEVFAEIKSQNKRRKKLYDNEYVAYVMAKKDLNQGEVLEHLKEKFVTFANFYSHVKSNQNQIDSEE